MSETKPSNPNAFPLVVQKPHGVEYFPGMTLRDYFAAKALAGIVGNFDVSRAICDNDPRYDDTNFAQVVALNAYEFADAMLKAREAKP